MVRLAPLSAPSLDQPPISCLLNPILVATAEFAKTSGPWVAVGVFDIDTRIALLFNCRKAVKYRQSAVAGWFVFFGKP